MRLILIAAFAAIVLLVTAQHSRASSEVKIMTGPTVTLRAGPQVQDGRAAKAASYLDVQVQPSWYFEGPTGLYVYRYAVYNLSSSTTSIDLVGVSPIPSPHLPSETAHWMALDGYQGDSTGIVWGVIDDGATFPDDGLSVYESQYNPQPGSAAVTFELRSPFQPGSVIFYAMGYEPLQVLTDEDTDPDDVPTPTIWGGGVSGSILGPSLNPTVDVPEGAASRDFEYARPNPAKGEVEFRFFAPQSGQASIDIKDVTGRLAGRVDVGRVEAGWQTARWNGRSLGGLPAAAGVYYYAIKVGGRVVSNRSIVIVR